MPNFSPQLGVIPIGYFDPQEIYYWSDFGSDLFLGDFASSRETSSWAQGGMPTFPSRIISLALNFLP